MQTSSAARAALGAWTCALLIACGGGALNGRLMQRLADLLGAAVDRPVVMETTALGAAYLAGLATGVFPNMVLQMCAIGEESGSIDHMLGKAADFYEAEVDDMVAGISSLMEPIIIVFLGTLIGGIVVAMYMPIFKLGSVV